MTQVFNYDKIERVDVKAGKWVRIKSGIFEGDLAQVIHVEDPVSKIYLKLIPRINESLLRENDTSKAFGKKPLYKPKQKLFNPNNYPNADIKKITLPVIREQVYIYNKMAFQDGFLVKSMRAKALILDDVDPKLDELRIFNYSKYKKGEDEGESGLADLISTIQETELNKKKYFKQGDKVRIITGSLKNIPGKVVSHSNKLVSLIPEIDGYNEIIELPEEYLVKLFLPGDLVKVYRGPNSSKYGLVTKVEDEIAFVYSDTLNSEFKVSCRDLILSSQMVDETDNNSYYQLGDLVKVNGTNLVCYVLDVFKHYLKVIDTRNEIKNCNLKDLTKITQK
jgi:transcription elongation factor SPT5